MKQNAKQLALEALENGYLISLGICDADGPWVADVIYVHDDEMNIYWMSKPQRRHSIAIDGEYSHVAGSVTVSVRADQSDEGLQISGVAEKVESPSADLLKQWFKKRGKTFPLTEILHGIVLIDHDWYKLTPDRIELIHKEAFGRDRKTIK